MSLAPLDKRANAGAVSIRSMSRRTAGGVVGGGGSQNCYGVDVPLARKIQPRIIFRAWLCPLRLSACIFSFQSFQDEHTEVAITKRILAPLASAE